MQLEGDMMLSGAGSCRPYREELGTRELVCDGSYFRWYFLVARGFVCPCHLLREKNGLDL